MPLKPAVIGKPKLRPLALSDQDAAIRLLCEGFPRRDVFYWQKAWSNLQRLEKPSGNSQFGYVIEDGRQIVGVLFVIASKQQVETSNNRANLSSWYVKPEYRSFATLLLARACKDPAITYLNISAASHTFAICEALGFRRYTVGQSLVMPLLIKNKTGSKVKVKAFGRRESGLEVATQKLMEDHQNYGCLCMTAANSGSEAPFIFVRRMLKGFIPVAQLIYCRSNEEFLGHCSAIGKYLAKRGLFLVLLDTSGPLPIPSLHYPGRSPKYYKGPVLPQINDLAYTEVALFGI